jgi:L-ascorbate metabolism protein UlaG (beta-lactamase superfamily)
MKYFLPACLALIGIVGLAAKPPAPTLAWRGQSCFILVSPAGKTILIDPFGDQIGYPVSPVKADAVFITHNHRDHNNAGMAEGKPPVFKGLDAGGNWVPINTAVGDVKVTSVPLYHDDRQGALRGKNTAFIFETGGLRIVHLGDLGHTLTPDQIAQFGPVDVLLIPVGGVYTIDADGAAAVVAELKPRIVIPMHYKTPKLIVPLAPVDKFLAGRKNVVRVKGSRLELGALPAEQTTYVLEPGTWPPK